MPKKHYKTGKNSKNKIGPVLTLDLDQFLTLETPNLGPVLTLQHIYIYIYASGLVSGQDFSGFMNQ